MDRSKGCRHLKEIFSAGLAAVDPFEAVCRSVKREGEQIVVAGRPYPLRDFERIYVIGSCWRRGFTEGGLQ